MRPHIRALGLVSDADHLLWYGTAGFTPRTKKNPQKIRVEERARHAEAADQGQQAALSAHNGALILVPVAEYRRWCRATEFGTDAT